MKNTLPTGWESCEFGDIAKIRNGYAFKSKDFKKSKELPTDIPLVKQSQLVGSKIDFSEAVYLAKEFAEDNPNYLLKKGDILIGMSGSIGKLCYYEHDLVSLQNQRTGKIEIFAEKYLHSKYLGLYLSNIENELVKKAKGMGVQNISGKDIEALAFPLPTFNEQQRIVVKIEELFSELDNGIAALKTAREQLKVYRQAVLKHAFEGKLTAKWREENTDKLESPEQLLARIQQEREARYQQQLEEWEAAVKKWEEQGKEGKKPGKPSKLANTKMVSTTDFETPSEWAISELGLIAYESVLGKMLDKQKNIGTERPYLGNINVRWGRFEIDELKTMKIEESELARYSLVNGDLVICEGGEPGRCAVWSGDDGVIFIQKALHRVRFSKSYLTEFAFYYLTYAVPLERVVKHFTGTTIKHLTGAGLSKVQLPVCSSDEQREIVSIIESKLSEIDALDSELDIQLAKVETLRQSILKKAFSGQLVPQDPSDEPASELLARIQAEKAASKAAQKASAKPKAAAKSGAKRGRKPKAAS